MLNKPLRKTFLFPSPLRGTVGVNTIKSFRPQAKGYRFLLCISCNPSIRPSQSKQVPVQSRRRRGGYVVGTFQPPGEPLKQVLVPLSVGRELFSIGDLSIRSSLFPKILQRWVGSKTFDGTAPTIT